MNDQMNVLSDSALLHMAQTMMMIPLSRNRNSTYHLVFTLLFALLVAPPCQAGLKEGLTAYDRADYVTAQRELTPLAEKGGAKAQNKLGRMSGKNGNVGALKSQTAMATTTVGSVMTATFSDASRVDFKLAATPTFTSSPSRTPVS